MRCKPRRRSAKEIEQATDLRRGPDLRRKREVRFAGLLQPGTKALVARELILEWADAQAREAGYRRPHQGRHLLGLARIQRTIEAQLRRAGLEPEYVEKHMAAIRAAVTQSTPNARQTPRANEAKEAQHSLGDRGEIRAAKNLVMSAQHHHQSPTRAPSANTAKLTRTPPPRTQQERFWQITGRKN